MARETPSPPPARSARRRSFSDRGRDTQARRDGRSRSRELSPWSARRALTAKQNEDRNPPHRRSRSRSHGRPSDGRPQKDKKASPVRPERRSQSRSKHRKPRDRSRDRQPKDAPPEGRMEPDAGPGDRGREGSPEPYRKPRERSEERNRDSSRNRDRSRDRKRERSRDRKRDTSGDRKRDRSRSKDRRRDRSQDKDRKRNRSRDHHRERKRDDRSRSPLPYRSYKRRDRSRSRSGTPSKRRRRSRSRSRSPLQRSKKPLPSQEVSFRGLDNSAQPPSKYGGAPPDREKPNFKTTGALAKHANKVEGTKISLKYHEPPEARKPPPSAQWRLFVFKGDDVVDTVELHIKSCWLLGRAHEVADIVLEHPSSSGQHAVIQFRYIQKTVEDEFGVRQKKGKVKPYIIDLESSNGTELNGSAIETSRYFELRDKDILKFAGSEREYVIMLPPPEK